MIKKLKKGKVSIDLGVVEVSNRFEGEPTVGNVIEFPQELQNRKEIYLGFNVCAEGRAINEGLGLPNNALDRALIINHVKVTIILERVKND